MNAVLPRRLTIISFFRDAAGLQVHRFIKQCALLQAVWPGAIRIVAVYGDCMDATKPQLLAEAEARNLALHLVEYNTKVPRYGSTEQPERMAALSRLSNCGLDFAATLLEMHTAEQILYVESDLIWDADVIVELMHSLDSSNADAMAPLVFAGENFYDVWAFRGLDGQRFSPFPPYHSSLKGKATIQVSSVGSCFLMERWVLENVRIKNEGALVGFWREAKDHGFSVKVSPGQRVRHPA